MSDDIIMHFGVKGMKWGVRKATKVRASANSSEDHIMKKVAKKTPISQMSTAQLKKANERMQAEKTYRELTSKGGLNKIKKGTATVGAITAAATAGATIYNLVKSPAGQAAIVVGKRAINKYIHGAIALPSG